MADYIYLLENRLSPAQQKAIGALRTSAREIDATIFLTGGAVRDLTAGASIRDLDLTIQGDLAKAKKAVVAAGFELVGENPAAQQLFLVYPGGVRVELSSAVSVTWPKPGKPKYEPGNLIEDLRSRDFTANAMAISLNEGSYGLLMDPLNGVADIENRELRLVSNYGFIEEPSRLIRAVRLMSRLGWQMEEKTRQRYETAKEEGYISALSAWNKGYELEEIFHEEDTVRVLRSLENEGWMQHLFPALQHSKANTAALSELYQRQGDLQMQGILGQIAAISFPLITAKMSPADVAALKTLLARQGFVREIESLEGRVKEFGARFLSKEAAAPSAAWKMLHATEPNLVLAMAYGSKGAPVQTRLKTFLTESPAARQRIPYSTLTEMRITPDLPEYNDLLDRLFFELMDHRLSTPEEMKAFLEPYSPPAPPPPPNLRRARARKETKGGRGKKKAVEAEDLEGMPLSAAADEESAGLESGLTEVGDLTGPDRGTSPSETKSIDSVAPTAKAVPAKKPAPAKNAAKPVAVSAAPAADGKKTLPLSGKTEPAPAVGKAPAVVKKPVAVPPQSAGKSAVPVKSAVKTTVPGKTGAKSASTPVVKAAAAAKSPATKVPVTASAKKVAVKIPVVAKKTPPRKIEEKKSAPVKKAVLPSGKKSVPVRKTVPVKTAKKVVAAKKPASAVPVKKTLVKVVKAAATKSVPTKKSARPAKTTKKAATKKSGRR